MPISTIGNRACHRKRPVNAYADVALGNRAYSASLDGDAMLQEATYVNEGLAFQVINNLQGVPKALILVITFSTSEELPVKVYPILKIPYVEKAFGSIGIA